MNAETTAAMDTMATKHDWQGKTIVPMTREHLLLLLKRVCGVIESSQVMEILSHVRLTVQGDRLTLMGTDSEVEISASTTLDQSCDSVDIAIAGKKLFDICKNLPEGAALRLIVDDNWATLQTQGGYFTLGLLSPEGFPVIDVPDTQNSWRMSQSQLIDLIGKTAPFMGVQDIRYYLNGLCLSLRPGCLEAVAIDGYRFAKHEVYLEHELLQQVIIPRKAVFELAKQLESGGGELEIRLTDQHMEVVADAFTWRTSLVNASYPSYDHFVHAAGEDEALLEVAKLRQMLSCSAAILSQEPVKAARFHMIPGCLTVSTTNVNQEKTEESMNMHYQGGKHTASLCIDYVRDVLGVIDADRVRMQWIADRTWMMFRPEGNDQSVYVVMSMTL